ncbi:MAG: DNA polymerase III subunit delta [Bryobacteraceae bacterium]
MTPDQFVAQVQKQPPGPAYLFLGPEAFQRDRCRKALLDAVLPEGDREDGYTRHDLHDLSLAEILDDARALSLFASNRVIWLGSAESLLPKGRASAASDDDGETKKQTPGAALKEYLRAPTPGTTLVFDANRWEFDNDNKTKIEGLTALLSPVPVIEFRPFSPDNARRLAQDLAKKVKLQLGLVELGILIEALGFDAARISQEIEKLSLFAGTERRVTAEDIAQLVPNAQQTTIFALVAALARNDRQRSLELLDTLVREGEYLPLVLTFVATQFRLALVAREAKLRSAGEIQAHFTKLGMRMWRERAEQVAETMSAFPKAKLETALKAVFESDVAFRDTRPDDRIVMERLILALS